ncbi:transglycosylase SLT domain-containing protein [Mycobacterium sp. pUA109]|uniref:lytic transglycosylase domain-containing protein n=1 Tax=Mycobacterium sp. pUA109 TaxID=3238982 RepID=UPI00351B8D53
MLLALALATAAPTRAEPPPADPVALADSLVAAEQTLRDPSSPDAALTEAAHHQQAAYRALGWHPDWDAVVRPRIPAPLLDGYDHNLDARRQMVALVASDAKAALPAWRIDPPAPADELLGYYHEAEAATGVGWNYLAAINFIETTFGRVVGASSADARGPMQFLPATFARYGDGGDISSPHDAVLAAGRYLAANGFAANPDRAVFAYNHSEKYVRAISDYATVMGADPAAFAGYYRWDVYCHTTAGDVLLPVGYAASAPIPVGEYLANHPQ